MKGSHNNLNNAEEEDLIDIVDIVTYIKKIWKERLLIVKTSISFFFIGCIIAVFSPVIYTSQTTFVPQVSGDDINANNNRLGSLASLAGINLNPTEETSDSYLSPFVYSLVIDSEEFSQKILSTELKNTNADKFTIREYLLSKKSSINFNPIEFIKKYTIGLFLNNDANEINPDIINNYNFISQEDYSLIKSFREKFLIKLNEDEGYIEVQASDEDPFISSQLVEIVTKSLQSKIIEIRTKKIKERLDFSKKQYEVKREEFDSLQKKLAEFKDSNKNISTASFMSELQKLESDYELQKNILVNLASEYNNNKIKLNKNTPIFSVIDEVTVPNVRSKPKRGLIVIANVFIGLILSVGFVLGKEPLINLIKEIKD